MHSAKPDKQTVVGYLLKTFPKVSETFILNEILGLERQGVSLEIFSLTRPAETEFQCVSAKVRAPVWYLPYGFASWALPSLRAHARLWRRDPRRYAKAVRLIAGRKEGLTLFKFLKAGFLASLLEERGIQRLHAHFANVPAAMAELVHLLTGIPFSFTAHAKDIYLSDHEILNRKIHHAEFVLTCTEYNRAFLQSVSTNGTPIHRLYHGLDLDRFQPALPDPGSADETVPVLLSVGRLREKKGFPVLLHACRLLKERGRRFRCQIVGYGPLQPELERMIQAHGLTDCVFLLGKKPHAEVLDLYRQATVFVLPCQIAGDGDRDGIPNVLLEAMAMQVPVISTDVSGIPELIDHMNNGLTVPPENPVTLAQAIAHLLDTPTLRVALARAGRDRVSERFSQSSAIKTLHTLFNGTSEALL
jgi:glycosyltransferase involved in cell wall biosynthesis